MYTVTFTLSTGMSGSPLGLKIVGSPWGSLVVGVQSSGAAARYNKDQDSEKRKEKEAASASGSGSGDQDQDQDRNQNQDQDQESQDQGSHGQTALNIRPGDVILSMTDQSGRTTDVAAMSHTDVAKFVRMKLISVDRTLMRLGRVGLQEARRLSRWAMSSHYFDVEVEKPLGITFGQTQAGFFISHIEPRGNAQQQWNMRAAASASVFSASSSALSSRSSGGLAALGGLGSKRGSSLPALKGTGGLGKLPLGQHKHRASLSLSKNALGASQLSSSLSSAPDARLPRHHKLYCGLALVAIQEKENNTFIIEDDSMKKLHALIDTRTNERVILRFRHYSENELKRLRRWCTAAAIPSSSSAGGNDGGLGRIWDIFFRGPKASPSPSPTPSPHPSPSPSSSAQDTEDPNKDDFFGETFAPLDLENFDFRSKFYI